MRNEEPEGKRLNILFFSSEAAPFAKTGGLGDVAGALPRTLAAGETVTLIMPGYRTEPIRRSQAVVADEFTLAIGPRTYAAVVKKLAVSPRFSVCFIHNEHFFGRDGLYGDETGDYIDNFSRFLFYQKAALEFLSRSDLPADILHCNDWQTALIPLLARSEGYASRFVGSRTVFTIHNLGYQGIFPAAAFSETNLPGRLFSPEYLEFYGDLNCLKAGVIFSDRLLTVSPTYAREIVTPEHGFGLDGLLAKFSGKLSGILNGVDYGQWDPRSDPFIARRYSSGRLEEKSANKEALFGELGLAGDRGSPLLVMITRLSQQKGIDLLPRLLPALFAEGFFFVLLGKGDRSLTAEMTALAGRFPERMRFLDAFDEGLAHKLQAAGDLLFMPSHYEPCGLNQIYAMRYGTVPVVRATGGLEDSVEAFDAAGGRGTGFKFQGKGVDAPLAALRCARELFADRGRWRKLQENGMAKDFSWEQAAPRYLHLYRNILLEGTQHV